ncbi:MAG: DUF2809 domain-containing protein [Eubacterium sp.]|nr:DUF2809 domain-containing protein [Eubacterium sp.]
MKNDNKLRIGYAVSTLLLIITEVLIALFVHDNFVRPYLGDGLVVIAVYCAVRIIAPTKCRLLPLYVFIFAVGVEVLQYFNIVALLGFENNAFMKTLIGSSFDVKDIACYAAGCAVLSVYEIIIAKFRLFER